MTMKLLTASLLTKPFCHFAGVRTYDRILMTYTEGLEFPFCSVTMKNAPGNVENGKPQAVPGQSNKMSVPLRVTALRTNI